MAERITLGERIALLRSGLEEPWRRLTDEERVDVTALIGDLQRLLELDAKMRARNAPPAGEA